VDRPLCGSIGGAVASPSNQPRGPRFICGAAPRFGLGASGQPSSRHRLRCQRHADAMISASSV
jgi:hypothetical protein